MSENSGKDPYPPGIDVPEWAKAIPNGTVFAYNIDSGKTSSGMGVRWKITVATGPEARRWDTRQAEAIKELLEWTTQHYQPPPQTG
jgi:hypothetical protein